MNGQTFPAPSVISNISGSALISLATLSSNLRFLSNALCYAGRGKAISEGIRTKKACSLSAASLMNFTVYGSMTPVAIFPAPAAAVSKITQIFFACDSCGFLADVILIF